MSFLFGLAVAWLGWKLWNGWSRPARPGPAPRDTDELQAARALLGVGQEADAEAIRAAHRRLVAQAHPDRGGSQELAGRLNSARDLLLRTARG